METCEIQLTQGQVVIIDRVDMAILEPFVWHAAKRGQTFYAASTSLKDKGYYMHRLLLGAKPGDHVDHRNGNGLDNRRENLRVCSNAENRRNMRVRRGASPYKGVARNRNPGRPWEAYIWFENRKIGLGCYPTQVEAARAYNAAALEMHREFACLNIIEGLTHEESIVPPLRNRKPGRPVGVECSGARAA